MKIAMSFIRYSRQLVTIVGLAIGVSVVVCSTPAQGTAPQAEYYQFTPLVIRSDRMEPVLFQARVTGSPTRVVLTVSGQERQLRDDGIGGDPIASDGVYSLLLEPAVVVQGLQPDDVFRRFVGFLDVFQGSNRVMRGNVFANIITDEIPRLRVVRVAPDVQYTDHLVNIANAAFFSGARDVTQVTRRFYEFFADEYDFLNILYASFYFRNRGHAIVKNTVQGIGLSIRDDSRRYGSSGKLLGYSEFPNANLFDGAEPGYQHELGHQWINHLDVPPALPLNPGAHWPLSNLASGIMGWTLPGGLQGGDFPCLVVSEGSRIRLIPRVEAPVFTDLDLYLMGLLPPEQVGEIIVFVDQDFQRIISQCNNQIYTGRVTRVSIDEIIRRVGRRNPDWTQSPKRFKIATIIVSADGLLSQEEMAFFSFFAKRAEETQEVPTHIGFAKSIAKPFAISTRGLGSLETQILRR